MTVVNSVKVVLIVQVREEFRFILQSINRVTKHLSSSFELLQAQFLSLFDQSLEDDQFSAYFSSFVILFFKGPTVIRARPGYATVTRCTW